MSVIRAFIAIELSPEIQDKLKHLTSQLKQQLEGVPVKWVPVENIHLTLKFLGNVSITNIEVLERILEAEVSNHHPFEISVGELGAFPSTRRPRVAWVKLQTPPDLFEIQRCIEQETARLGYAREKRSFKPHLTLGRVSRNASFEEVRRVGEVLDSFNVGFLGAMRVKYVRLFRSDLKPTGAIYTRIHSAKLLPAQDEY
ncbi:MAG: RNA 2',3'-cyclic phosphodiesterase [Anaerolineales bacterium]|nr:RNA 2',3'-cyclic phosphodiesterase [Anaerolineales bacterium]